jgi:hypothetical protein
MTFRSRPQREWGDWKSDTKSLALLVKQYMAEEMAMPDIETDQEQNWIAGHLFTFAHRLTVAARRKRAK